MLKHDLSLIISINEAIATIKEPYLLFRTIFEKMQLLLHFEIAAMVLLDKTKTNLEFFAAGNYGEDDPSTPVFSYYKLPLSASPFESFVESPKVNLIDFSIIEPYRKKMPTHPVLDKYLERTDIKSVIQIPMQSGGNLIGFLLLPINEHELTDEDKSFILTVANVIASAVSNVRAFEEMKQHDEEMEMQLRLMNTLVTVKERDILIERCAQEINELIPCDYITLSAGHPDLNQFITFNLIKGQDGKLKIFPVARNAVLAVLTLRSGVPQMKESNSMEISGELFDKLCSQSAHFMQVKEKHSISTILLIRYASKKLGELNLILGRSSNSSFMKSRLEGKSIPVQNKNTAFMENEVDAAMYILPQLGLILANYFAYEQINLLKDKLEQEKNYLLDEINLTNNFQEIIGNSPAIQVVLNKVKQVAPIDATVLIQGETGTGKELVARAIHNLSERKDNAFVKINCASLPVQLIESELFGHEKGSFTGAIEKRIGKFELADRGTIFLDEIGELPLEIQSKLLRILQEKEFERIGGKSTIKVDVRIIAATNRELNKEVEKGRFRADLFFRLNVFPITVPPLRDRSEDIPLLLKFFIEKYSKKTGKEKKSVKKSDLDMLLDYDWPGNIRELEHLIERSIIISDGTTLNLNDVIYSNLKPEEDIESFKTLEEIEKEHILRALSITNGKVTGESSASTLLGINGKTLGSKMRKFGIKRDIVIRVQQ
ncbi:MAG: sigma 54-interacting transcriptional regulator [Bacteroidota bacterium]|nr:sigma 54-interacting transcriptional regulator [Bacteroidota bacterium]MDP4191830.1 sigma 54-interacting transcriptional regulator [Bacteroidota bacterium]MDP4195280.1 sigma 54-interacting transcriptional regulator [Bacteroidota bacterium]